MEHCPICRAQLNGGDICRRCRADVGRLRQIVRQSEARAEAAMHCLALGEIDTAVHLLARANTLRSTPEITWMIAKIESLRTIESGGADERQGRGDVIE